MDVDKKTQIESLLEDMDPETAAWAMGAIYDRMKAAAERGETEKSELAEFWVRCESLAAEISAREDRPE